MAEEIKYLIEEMLNFKAHTDWQFKEICGFTFVFKRKITEYQARITSFTIRPAGIIYTQDGEYYFAPLTKSSYDIDEIVKAYVREEESSRFPQ